MSELARARQEAARNLYGEDVDGDYLGERQKVHFLSVPDALRVIC